jgi:hypothetical protein
VLINFIRVWTPLGNEIDQSERMASVHQLAAAGRTLALRNRKNHHHTPEQLGFQTYCLARRTRPKR